MSGHVRGPADEVDALVDAIREHWLIQRGVDVETATAMAHELADHLTQAALDGKEPARVVGPDLRAFADGWADVHVPRRWGVGGQLAALVAGAVIGAGAAIGSETLYQRRSPVTVDLRTLVWTNALGALLAALFFTGFGSRLTRSTSVRAPVVVVARLLVLGAVAVAILAALGSLADGPVLELPLPVAAVAGLIGGAALVVPLAWRPGSVGVRWFRRLVDSVLAGF